MMTAGVLLAALSWFYLPGWLVGRFGGLRGLAAVALAPALSVLALGLGSLVGSAFGFAWGWRLALAATVLLALLAYLIGRRWPIRALRALPVWRPQQWVGIGLAALAAVMVSGGSLLIGFGGRLDRPGQRHDTAFHANLVRWIIDQADASPLRAGLLDHPARSSAYYPSTSHALAALLPRSSEVFSALNAMFLVGTTVVWTIGLVYLARVLFPRRPGLAALAAAWSALAGSAPSALVNLVPNAVALALLPALLAWSVQLARVVKLRRSGRGSRAVLLLAVLVGGCLAHPNLVFSYVVIAWPVVAYVLRVATLRAWRRGWRWAVVVAWSILLTLITLTVLVLATVPAVRTTFGYPRWETEQPLWLALAGGLTDATSLVMRGANPLWLVAVVGGLVMVWHSGRRRWLVLAWLTALVLYVVAAGGVPGAGWLTGAWYGERQRLGVLVTISGSALAGLGLAGIASWWRGQRLVAAELDRLPAEVPVSGRRWLAGLRFQGGWRRWLVAAGLTLASLANLVLLVDRPNRLADQGYRLVSTVSQPRLVNAAEWAMINRLAGQLDPAGLVLGNPANGSLLLYATIGQPVVFPHLTGAWDADRRLVAEHLGEIASDPAVCQALNRLGVRYLYSDPVVYYNLDSFQALDQAILELPSGFLRPVAAGGGAVVSELVGCD